MVFMFGMKFSVEVGFALDTNSTVISYFRVYINLSFRVCLKNSECRTGGTLILFLIYMARYFEPYFFSVSSLRWNIFL